MGEQSASSSLERDGELEQFVVAHALGLHRFLSRLTGGDEQLTADLVQSVFVTVLTQAQRPLLAELGLPWLLTVARSRFIDHVRASSSRRRREIAAHRTTAEVQSVDVGVVSADQARWMLAQLPDLERWALGLVVVDGMPVVELAGVLDRSVDATHSLLARARRRLRATMEGLPRDAH